MNTITRRDFVKWAGGAVTVTATGGLGALVEACGGTGQTPAAQPTAANVADLYNAAKKEGSVTWWTAHYEQSAAEQMATAFKQKYPGIDVNLLRQTAQVINTRLNQELKTGNTDCDVFCSTDEGHYPPLIKLGALAKYTPPDLDLIPKDFQNLNPDGYYHLGALGFVLINYRSDKVTSPPQTWKDFVDPKWKGQLTVGHPSFSGYVGQWVTAMLRVNGDAWLTALAKNNPKVNRSVNDTVTDIVAGERTVGAGPDNYSLAQKAKGQPIAIVFPSDGAVLVPGPVGILAQSKRPNAARLFVNFMYSKEYSQALVATSNYPLRTDVSLPPGDKPYTQIKIIRNTVDQLTKDLPAAQQKWQQAMGV
ncbi:MAG TPA: substrate-binding domain-containing protein [Candidatus Dormibacteraeota bacterium]